MSAGLLVVALGLCSVVLRAVPLVVARSWSPGVERALEHAATAALAALVVGDVTGPSAGHPIAMAGAAALAAVMTWRGRAMPVVVAAGVAAVVVIGALA